MLAELAADADQLAELAADAGRAGRRCWPSWPPMLAENISIPRDITIYRYIVISRYNEMTRYFFQVVPRKSRIFPGITIKWAFLLS